MPDFLKRVAVVTGAAGGIGRAMVRGLPGIQAPELPVSIGTMSH